MSAYACEPGKSSEPSVGWNVAREMARHHDVWVLTRANNRPAIEAAVAEKPVPGLHFIWHDLPSWARWWKQGQRGVQLYYYLWQLSAVRLVRRVHRAVGFDIAHHVTFVKYWVPTCLAFLPVPYVWGPVGGGESAPRSLWKGLSLRGQTHEIVREVFRWLAEQDPLVRVSASRARLAVATTEETATRLRKLRARNVEIFPAIALDSQDTNLSRNRQEEAVTKPLRFISIGNLIDLKGFHLGIQAFAEARLENSVYWIVGAGRSRRRLESLCRRLGIVEQVHFHGKLPPGETLSKLAESDVLLFPSLHDSGGFVCLEAMASGKPVVCLDLGGPSLLVGDECGTKVPATNVDLTVRDLATAMCRLAEDREAAQTMGEAGRRKVLADYVWPRKVEAFSRIYDAVLSEN